MDDATSASLLESGEVLPDMTDDDGGAEEKGGRCKFYTNLTRIQLQWSGPVVGLKVQIGNCDVDLYGK